jgi:suppressor for copper-sensitivity B
MVWLRPVLGLALLSTAIWLLFVLGLEAGTPVAGLGGATLAALLAALAWHRRLARGERSRRPIEAGAIALAILVVLMPSPSGEATPVELARSSNAAEPWQRFDEPALHRMISSRKTVRIDVPPASCLICKLMS